MTQQLALTRHAFLSGGAAVAVALPIASASAPAPSYGRSIESYFDAGRFDGVVAIARGGRLAYRGAAGFANRERRIAHAIGRPFRIASVTKQFTALLIMQEVERGALQLDAPLGTYLPRLPPDVAAITMRQALKNVSGLPNLDTIVDAYTRTDFRADDLPSYVARLPLTPLVASPGSTFSYNNLDFIIAGAALQSVTGKPFGTLLRERVLDVLGIASTGLYTGDVPASHVRGYEADGAALVPEKIGRIENFGPAGAMYSTLLDLERWDRALLDNELLGAEATREMFSGDRAFGFVALGSWTYDLAIARESKKVTLVERQGNIGGIQILNLFSAEDAIAIVMMANTDHADLFNTYSRTGLPYDLLSLAVREARASGSSALR